MSTFDPKQRLRSIFSTSDKAGEYVAFLIKQAHAIAGGFEVSCFLNGIHEFRLATHNFVGAACHT